jgi:hypothetical protein
VLSESCRFLENDVDWRDVGSVDRAQVRVGPARRPSLVDRSGRAVPKCAAVPRFAARCAMSPHTAEHIMAFCKHWPELCAIRCLL